MMNIIALSLIVLAIVILASYFDGRLPKKYRNRPCTGKSWKKLFPTTSKQEIRSFLMFFTNSFAFSEKNKLKFEPDDKLIDIYRELYP